MTKTKISSSEKHTAKTNQDEDPTDFENDSLIVVGIGSSAGGLEALQLAASILPRSDRLCYVVAQHLSPSYKSMMVDLLEKDSSIPVLAASDGIQLEADHLYICPPNSNIEVTRDNRLTLTETKLLQSHMPKPSIDLLFESLAVEKRENAIGIVLSGTGSDGARGLRAIKGEGGIAIVQDPETAKFDGMPRAAINTGNIDLILAPEEIGEKLANLISFPRLSTYELGQSQIPVSLYRSILKIIQRTVDIDFSLYKESTILRRINRRMVTLKFDKAENYYAHLQKNPSEAEFLYRDFLIGVTSFFRDVKAFDALKMQMHTYIQSKDKNDNLLRIWIAGCSTGEEAYSIAMMFSEILGSRLKEYKIQIFATDIDRYALETANTGIYPESALKNVPEEFRKKYFRIKGDSYEVDKPLKAMILFSLHNVVSDPPFLKLDLISCRNLLIYFGLELQKAIIPLFHYALKDNGILFLGKSESVGVYHDYFKPLNRTAKIFEALFLGKKFPPPKPVSAISPGTSKQVVITRAKIDHSTIIENKRPSLSEIAATVATKLILPSTIVVNENMDIIYVQGDNPLLIRPQGEPTNNVYKNMLPVLSADLRAAIHQVAQNNQTIKTDFQKIILNDKYHYARLIVSEAPDDLKLGQLYVIFIQTEDELQVPVTLPDVNAYERASDALIKEQERQITNIRTQLQTVIEELETSNEEMQSLNEELQSSNEELQSSNEELETTNEELQSTNEELQTAYTELRLAYEEKDKQKKQIEEVQLELERASSMISEAELLGKNGSWMMELNERKMRWSSGCYALFGLKEDTFSPSYEALVGLTYQDDRSVLEKYFNDLVNGKAQEPLKIRCNRGASDSFWLQISAYVSVNDLKKPIKVLGNMLDITAEVLHQRESEKHSNLFQGMIQNSLNGIYLFDFKNAKNTYINEAYTALTGYTQQDLDKMSHNEFINLFKPEEVNDILKHIDEVKQSKNGEIFPIKYHFKNKAGHYDYLISHDSVFEYDTTGQAVTMLGNFKKFEFLEDNNE